MGPWRRGAAPSGEEGKFPWVGLKDAAELGEEGEERNGVVGVVRGRWQGKTAGRVEGEEAGRDFWSKRYGVEARPFPLT